MSNESYPPLFNQQSHQTQILDVDEPIPDVEDLDLIPVIDLQCLSLDELEEAGKDSFGQPWDPSQVNDPNPGPSQEPFLPFLSA